MKKIFVYAYMAQNLGDDLMVRILCDRYPNAQFYLYSDKFYKTAFKDIKNLIIYSSEDKEVKFWNKTLKHIKKTKNGFMERLMEKCDATVHIGGSVFIQHNDDYSAFLKADEDLRKFSKKVYLIGSNFGPYKDEQYYLDYHQLLSTYDGVSFRDYYSYNKFKDIPHVVYAPDVVFNYQADNSSNVEHRVLFSTISLAGRNDNFAIIQYWEVYRKFIQKLAKRYLELGYKITFLSFCEPQGDFYEINEIVKTHDFDCFKDKIEINNYNGNIEESISLIKESEIIVGTRFHSIILGWLFNKPVLPIVYDNKTLQVLKDMNLKNYASLEELEKVSIDDLIGNIEIVPSNQIAILKNSSKIILSFLIYLLMKVGINKEGES